MTQEAPPTTQPIILDESGVIATAWAIFFNSQYIGDAGDVWVPTFQTLSTSGGVPQITGRIFRLSQALKLFTVTITPYPGGNSTSTAGTTYIDNFPYIMQGNGICFAVSGNLGTNSGMCDKSTNRIYVPGWSAVTVPLTIMGISEAT